MKGIWFALGFAVALVIIGAMALAPLLHSRAKTTVEPPPSPAAWPTATRAKSATPTLVAPTAQPTPTPPSPQPTRPVRLVWQRVNSLNGRCDRLEIGEDHAIRYAPCDQGPRVAYPTYEELDRYLAAVQRLAPFRYTVQSGASSVGSAMVSMELAGQGTVSATAAEQAELAAWAAQVYERVYEAELRADLVALARLDMAGRRGTTVEAIEILSVEAVTWPDACLGIHTDGLFCAQVETPGYRILFRADDGVYEYHTDTRGLVKRVPLKPTP